MKFKLISAALAFAALTTQAEERRYRLGVEAMWSQPVGSLDSAFTGSKGTGIGLFLDLDLGQGHGLRWDIAKDVRYPEVALPGNADTGPLTANLSSQGSALSYTYHLNKTTTGLYFMAGLGARRFRAEADLPGGITLLPGQGLSGNALPSHTGLTWDTGAKLAYQVGGGYDWNRFGATVRYQSIQSQGRSLGSIETCFNFRF